MTPEEAFAPFAFKAAACAAGGMAVGEAQRHTQDAGWGRVAPVGQRGRGNKS